MDLASLASLPPEYINEFVGDRLYGVAYAFIFLAIGSVMLRFASRRVSRTPMGPDDFLIIPSLLFCLGLCILGIVEVKIAGIGRHLPALMLVDPSATVRWAKYGYAFESLYCVAVAFPKLSIIAAYLRILRAGSHRMIAYIVAGVVLANAFAGVTASLASCKPFSARWHLELVATQCIDILQLWRWISFPNIVTDLVLVILPVPVILKLMMPRKQRIALLLVFMTGSLGIIAAIIRFSIFFRATVLTDGTFLSADLAKWSIIESGLYTIAACLPPSRPLMVKSFELIKGCVGGSDTSDKRRSQSAPPRSVGLPKGHTVRVRDGIEFSWAKLESQSRGQDGNR